MASYRHSLIAREGRWLLLSVALANLVIWLYFPQQTGIAVFSGLVFLFLLWLHRDPARDIPAQPLAVVSPICGVIDHVGEGSDPHLQQSCHVLHITMRWYDIWSLRSPVEGKIMETWHGRISADGDIRYITVWLQTDEKSDVVFSLRRNRHSRIPTGQRFGQGQRFGWLYFGTTQVQLHLPLSSSVAVSVNEQVHSGESVLAQLQSPAEAERINSSAA